MGQQIDSVGRTPSEALPYEGSILVRRWLSPTLPIAIAAILLKLTLALPIAMADSDPVTFADVTDAAGVALINAQWGAAWADYDGDGYLDVYVGNHAESPSLYRNNGNGTFTDMLSSSGIVEGPLDRHGVAWGDYNNDGAPDLYIVVGRAEDGSNFYVNNGDGTFTDQAAAAGVLNQDGRGRNTRWADYDNDGDLDLFIANSD
jgi:hypothetical protein